jgi:membrane-bound metal-dependent hydrolase YbcI (DUF457 family)
MFIGHFAVGLAAKRVAPEASLGPLIAAPILLDLLWPAFVLLGWERVRIDLGNTAFTPLAFDHYPWSHSLLMSAVWGALLAVLYWRGRAGYGVGAGVLAAGVVSHWVLDWITHRPDLPLYPGRSPLLGLGLWNSPPATIVIESLMFAAAVWLYATGTQARDRTGRYVLWAFIGVLALSYAADVLSSAPPPSVTAIAWTGLIIGWACPFWAAWFDGHRGAVGNGQ